MFVVKEKGGFNMFHIFAIVVYQDFITNRLPKPQCLVFPTLE